MANNESDSLRRLLEEIAGEQGAGTAPLPTPITVSVRTDDLVSIVSYFTVQEHVLREAGLPEGQGHAPESVLGAVLRFRYALAAVGGAEVIEAMDAETERILSKFSGEVERAGRAARRLSEMLGREPPA